MSEIKVLVLGLNWLKYLIGEKLFKNYSCILISIFELVHVPNLVEFEAMLPFWTKLTLKYMTMTEYINLGVLKNLIKNINSVVVYDYRYNNGQ